MTYDELCVFLEFGSFQKFRNAIGCPKKKEKLINLYISTMNSAITIKLYLFDISKHFSYLLRVLINYTRISIFSLTFILFIISLTPHRTVYSSFKDLLLHVYGLPGGNETLHKLKSTLKKEHIQKDFFCCYKNLRCKSVYFMKQIV